MWWEHSGNYLIKLFTRGCVGFVGDILLGLPSFDSVDECVVWWAAEMGDMVNDGDMDDDKDRESIPMMKTGKWIYC